MSVRNPVANFFAVLRNAMKAGKDELIVPNSRLVRSIAKILKDEGYVQDFRVGPGAKKFQEIRIGLRYVDRKPVITSIQPVSMSGRRIYWKKDEIKKVRNGMGIVILTTSRGVMTDHKARALGVGGEVVCTVY
jgi:small subunit ribosomal protein S8